MVTCKKIKFITKINTIEFELDPAIYTDPNTNLPYKYAEVHGRTWQTTFFSDLLDGQIYAFTPCPCVDNHRGIYIYCSEDNVYKLNKY